MDNYYIKQPVKVTGCTVHGPARPGIPVYDKTGLSGRLMIKVCSGLEYEKI